MFELVDQLAAEGIVLEHIDLGGGIGIRYRDEETIDLADYARGDPRLCWASVRSSCCSSRDDCWSATPACC